MGAYVCKRAIPAKVLIVGLDCAGKTSILYRMALGEVITTIPTIGFNVECVNIGGIDVTCWDVGGRDKSRPLIRHYFQNTQGIVCVIDSSDRERLNEALDELENRYFYEDELRESVFMVLANKQDIEGALTLQEIESELNRRLENAPNHHLSVIMASCSAITGDGLKVSFKCLLDQIQLQKSNRTVPGIIRVSIAENHDVGKSQEESGHIVKLMLRNPVAYFKSLLFY